EARVVDVTALQRRLSSASHELKGVGVDEATQVTQFVSLILIRLFDDLELVLVQKHSEEVGDLAKQVARLGNILSFCGMPEALPILAYIVNMLPLSFEEASIGEGAARRYDSLKMQVFLEKAVEILNCLVYILRYLSERYAGFDMGRFAGVLETLYESLCAVPGLPSAEAPLPVRDSVNPEELTSRTVNKLARTLETLITESLHYLEACVSYGYSCGYREATSCLSSAIQIAKEYNLSSLLEGVEALHRKLASLVLPNKPCMAVYDRYDLVCDRLEVHFPKAVGGKKLRHLRALISKLADRQQGAGGRSFAFRWRKFLLEAGPYLPNRLTTLEAMYRKLAPLHELARCHGIAWVEKVVGKLMVCWEVYPEACGAAYLGLALEMRSFPTEDIGADDLEQLNHERLRVLFERNLSVRPPKVYSVIRDALGEAEKLLQQIEQPEEISTSRIEDILIDARRVQCHALVRIAEVLLALLERIPAREGGGVVAPEGLMSAIYHSGGLFKAICERMLRHLAREQNNPVLTSRHIFYEVLLSLYQPSGQPRDSVTYYIQKRLRTIADEVRLVWSNTSTPTSTEYYCGLLRSLLHLATVCELKEIRLLILAHLDDIPSQDFIRTENRTMHRQSVRIVRALEESCPELAAGNNSAQIQQFFSKAIAVLNQVLSLRESREPSDLRTEILQAESTLAPIGLTTDFLPAIAFVFELRQLLSDAALGFRDVETLLYLMINVAHNVCPDWQKTEHAGLEFIRLPFAMPMSFFQRQLEALQVLSEAFKPHASSAPVAWESLMMLQRTMREMVTYFPTSLQLVVENAQNRCRYLKKIIHFELDAEGFPDQAEISPECAAPEFTMALTTIIDRLVELIIDSAFTSTDDKSRIRIGVQTFADGCSVSLVHNGKRFTYREINEVLAKANIMPAHDDTLFDLVVSSKRLALTYPPAQAIAYILPILGQFDGKLEISDEGEDTRFYISFKH
ncbi:MAG: hypothetical protein FWC40_05135, partial [Proteobacteria bacterium]|nr:hypothetical protein [Pseudomonadota bacterium]